MSSTRRYLARFAEVSRKRLLLGRAAAGEPGADLRRVARELHSMAGEAGLLGVPEVMALARAAEQAVVELASKRSPDHLDALECAFADLEVAVRNATRSALEIESPP